MVGRSELFAIHLPRLPVTNVGGGAELRALDTVARIEPYGVIQFSEQSRQIIVTEPENRNVEVRIVLVSLSESKKFTKTISQRSQHF